MTARPLHRSLLFAKPKWCRLSARRFASLGLCLVATCLVLIKGPSRTLADSRYLIMDWGDNTPQAQKEFHFSGVRQGCSSQPASCVSWSSGHDKVFLSILLKPDTIGYGFQYSELSRKASQIQEVGVDDFIDQYYRLYQSQGSNAPGMLDTFITGLKSANPNLKFGITLYDDDLTRSRDLLSDPKLPAAVRAEVDYVHFYVHFRGDSSRYAENAKQTKSIFPQAHIIAGVYAYDRINYLPCTPGGSPCTAQQELSGANTQMDAAIGMLKSGDADWIEFYPGYFGKEDQWPSWNSARICAPERRQACIENTREMRAAALSKLNALFQ